ncbi:3174_t:CDS:1, partial [Cetraspora pellucida]
NAKHIKLADFFNLLNTEQFTMHSNNKKGKNRTLLTSLETNGFKIKHLNSTLKYSVIEVSFENFFYYLLIWNEKNLNNDEYRDLYNTTSKFKRGQFIIVGNSMIDKDGNDKLELFAEETNLHIKNMLYFSGEYKIINHIKQEYFSHYADKKNIKKELFIYYMT